MYSFNDKTLWYGSPAEDWNKALPVGNGRIGAMVFGQPLDELIQLNEDSVWSGGAIKRNNPSALGNLRKVRNLIKDGNIAEAEKTVSECFSGVPESARHYMPLGDLRIRQFKDSDCTYESRSLDLETAVCTTVYRVGNITYTREVICSSPEQVLAVHISASKKGSISLKVGMGGRNGYFDCNTPVSDSEILFSGGCGGKKGIQFAAFVKVLSAGGSVYASGGFITAEDCDEVTILLGAQTSFRTEDCENAAKCDVLAAAEKSYRELLEEHTADYKVYFDRAGIALEDDSEGASALPTDERLARIKEGKRDSLLTQLYFDYGRYLMISGSREGTLPLNLQGIWNKDMEPAWGSRFTVNINTEMNYWLAEVCALGELHSPLFDHIERIRENGRTTAEEMYGCRGFVCHHNTDIWGDTAPQDIWLPATQWPLGAAWLCLHIRDHYLYTLDKEFLAKKYDTLKEASMFFVDFLIPDKQGRLVTCPSVSPENTYITEKGKKGHVCMGPSMDSQIIYELFSAVIESGEILDKDHEYCNMLKSMRDKLPVPEIGKNGQIMEWLEDYDEDEPGHRHISQLFALYPASRISMRKTPELAKAARITLERRLENGGGHTGWSRAWIINHRARLFDGKGVEDNLQALLADSTADNLFDMHPPFQIDGNFGGAAGIAEALLQSTNGEVILLPALCPSWKSGNFKGLRARGGFKVSCVWANGRPTECTVRSLAGETLRLVLPAGCVVSGIKCKGRNIPFDTIGTAVKIDTVKNGEYKIALTDR